MGPTHLFKKDKMKNTGLRLAVAVAVLYALFVSFMVTKIADESTLPGSSQITVSGDEITTAGEGLNAIIQGAADSSGATVVREIRDLRDASARHFYIATSPGRQSESNWLEDGYPGFSHNVSTFVHPATDLEGVDPRGKYYVIGPNDALDSVSQVFQNLNYSIETSKSVVSTRAVVSTILVGALGSATFVALLLVTLLTGFSVLTRVKNYAILRLHGGTIPVALKRDLRQELPATIRTSLSLTFLSLVALFFYNGWNQLGRYFSLALIVIAVAFVVIGCLYVATLYVSFDSKILEAIKGRLGFRVAVPATYLIRIPSLILAVSLIASTFAAAMSAHQAKQSLDAMAQTGSAARIVFEGHVSPEEMDKLAYASGKWLKDQDNAGNTIMAEPLLEKSDGTEFSEDVLMVNRGYLQRNPVIDSEGNSINDVPENRITVMLPEQATTSMEDVTNSLLANVRGNYSPRINHVQLRDHQTHPLYGISEDGRNGNSSQENAVIVAVGSNSGLISDDDYMASASQGWVLMADAEEALTETPKEFLGTWIAAYIPIGQIAANESADRLEALRLQITSALVALLVLLATAVGLAQIHVRGNSQSILVRFLHGWGFFSTHRWLFKGEAIVLAIAIGWAVVTGIWAAVQSSISNGPFNSADLSIYQWQPIVVLVVAVINLLLLLFMVRRRTNAMIRTHSEETA